MTVPVNLRFLLEELIYTRNNRIVSVWFLVYRLEAFLCFRLLLLLLRTLTRFAPFVMKWRLCYPIILVFATFRSFRRTTIHLSWITPIVISASFQAACFRKLVFSTQISSSPAWRFRLARYAFSSAVIRRFPSMMMICSCDYSVLFVLFPITTLQWANQRSSVIFVICQACCFLLYPRSSSSVYP